MPQPGFGIQFVYTDTKEPELATIVRDGDAVLMPRGYHPNVAAPGHRIGFLWAMAAHREKDDRQFVVVNVQPEFSQSGAGLEARRKKRLILEQFRRDGKTALVTGASRGLGARMAIALAEAGADVVCHGNSRSPQETCRAIETLGRRTTGIQADLAKSGAAETL